MPTSDSEVEADVNDDLEFDARSSEADEEDILGEAAEEASEGDEVRVSVNISVLDVHPHEM